MKVLSGPGASWLCEEADPLFGDARFGFPPRSRGASFPTSSLKERVLDWETELPAAVTKPKPTRQGTASELVALVRLLPVDAQREITNILKSLSVEVTSELWGTSPALPDVVKAALWHTSTAAAREQAVVDRSVSLVAASGIAGISVDQLNHLISEGQLSAIARDDVTWIPQWQFDQEGHLLKGVEELVASFPGSAPALAQWVERPHPDLGMTPQEALMHGHVDEVVFAATRGLATA